MKKLKQYTDLFIQSLLLGVGVAVGMVIIAKIVSLI
jgi:hypothetical protein